MSTPAAESLLVRVYCVAHDVEGHKALHEAIVEAARGAGLAGASVFSATMGFGHSGLFYSDLLNEVFSDRQPVVVEIIDQPDRIAAFLPALHAMVRGRRLITTERAEVVLYKPHAAP
jgi:PII-like signaling protein